MEIGEEDEQLVQEKMLEEDKEGKYGKPNREVRYSQTNIDTFAEILNTELSKEIGIDDSLHTAFINFNELLQNNKSDPYLFDLISQNESIQENLQELIISFNLRTGMIQPVITLHFLSKFCAKFQTLFFDEIFLLHIIERIDNPSYVYQTAISLETDGTTRATLTQEDVYKIRRHLLSTVSNILANIEITDRVRDILIKCIPNWIETFEDEILPHVVRMIVNIYRDDENGIEQREILLSMLQHYSLDVIAESCVCISYILNNCEDDTYIPRVIENILKLFQGREEEIRENIPLQNSLFKLFTTIASTNEWFFDSLFRQFPINSLYDIIQPGAYGHYYEMIARLIPLYNSKIISILNEQSMIDDLFESVQESSSSDVALILSALFQSLDNIDTEIAIHMIKTGLLKRFADLAPNSFRYAKMYIEVTLRTINLVKDLPQDALNELRPNLEELTDTDELDEAIEEDEFEEILSKMIEALQGII